MAELVTDEVVKTAAKSRWDYERAESGDTTEWEMRHPAFREFDVNSMRAALEAVAPAIAAAAWDEGYAEGSRGRMWDSTNPYCADATEPREEHRALVAADPLDESDHRPRHDRDGEHLYRHGHEHWHWLEKANAPCEFECEGARLTDADMCFGPLTFCDCPDPTDIEAENGATD